MLSVCFQKWKSKLTLVFFSFFLIKESPWLLTLMVWDYKILKEDKVLFYFLVSSIAFKKRLITVNSAFYSTLFPLFSFLKLDSLFLISSLLLIVSIVLMDKISFLLDLFFKQTSLFSLLSLQCSPLKFRQIKFTINVIV